MPASAGGRSLVRCMSRSLLYQCTQSLVILSTWPGLGSGPSWDLPFFASFEAEPGEPRKCGA